MLSLKPLPSVAAATALLATGCGSASSSSSSSSATPSGAAAQVAGSLSADARSVATGDIPDNQVFLVFTNHAARYSVKYPEGWTQTGSKGSVFFRDKNNVVHVVIGHGAAATPASVAAQLDALKRAQPSLLFRAPTVARLGSAQAVRVVYTTESAPNPVTGKRVTLIVDRYELASGGRTATVDLGTPRGVDNVDAYRMMIQSFRWR